MVYEGIGFNPVLGTQVRYDEDTATAEAWLTGEGGENYWETTSWLHAVQIGAPFDPLATPTAVDDPVFVPPELPDEKPWYDRILPGDQDDLGDLIPDVLEPDPGDDAIGAFIDPWLPGDQDTVFDIVPGVDAEGSFDLMPGEGGIGGMFEKLLPVIVVMSMFGRKD